MSPWLRNLMDPSMMRIICPEVESSMRLAAGTAMRCNIDFNA
jgi:hypothetical protein